MFGWHHNISGYELKQTLAGSEGQACFSPWVCKKSDTSEQQFCLESLGVLVKVNFFSIPPVIKKKENVYITSIFLNLNIFAILFFFPRRFSLLLSKAL